MYIFYRMHLFNESLKTKDSTVHKYEDDDSENPKFISQFGFFTTTCCGYIPQNNEWKDNWVVSILLLFNVF